MPELFQTLRGLIDRGRREGKKTGRFLILGWASIELLQQSSESHAGRIAYVELGPVQVAEIAGTEATLRRFHHARADLNPAESFVVYADDEQFPVEEGIEAIGLPDLVNVLHAEA
jgi:predicted AAA+ superfamily ATPase